MPGDESFSSIRVAFTTRWKVVSNLPKYWLEYKSRERRSKRSIKTKVLSPTSTLV